MKKITSLFFVTFLLASFTLISCNKDSAKNNSKSKGVLPQKEVSGPVLNIALDGTIDTVDPQKAQYADSFEIIGGCIDGLKQMAPDGSIVNAICEEETVSSDGKIYTFKLRKDAYWANGDPVTADDFVFAWQRAIDPATESVYAYIMSDIAHIKNAVAIQSGRMDSHQLGVRAIDNYTLRVELEAPVMYFDQLLCFCTFFPTNRKFAQKCGDAFGSNASNFLSNGEFILTEYEEEGKKITMIKNTLYYNAANTKLGGMTYTVPEDKAQSLALYNSGKLDVITISASDIPKYSSTGEYKPVDSGFMYFLSVGMKDPSLQNKNLRKALNLAFDRDKLAQLIADGSKASWNAVPSGFSFSTKGVDFSKDGIEFAQHSSYNPSAARNYLSKALSELGKSRIDLSIIISESKTYEFVCNEVIKQIEETLPDMHITLDIKDKKTYRKHRDTGDFQLCIANWGPDYADPMTYLSMWVTGNENNYGGFSNPLYDAIIASCNTGDLCTKADERWIAMKKAEEIAMDEVVIMPMYQKCYPMLIKPQVKGIDFHACAITKTYKNTSKQ